ncbi:MAG: MinD/ParA family protein [Sedimentisphaerales bacterium]|nr:MinD/ParA family protein [Sedimentisphaerales bacterium]
MATTSVEELAKLAAANSQKANVLAVASGKGGVGKTNVSANLAICLAALGKRVVVLDADFGLANLDIIFGINSKYNLSHFIKGCRTLDQICHTTPSGVDVICGFSGIDSVTGVSDFVRERIIRTLETLSDNYDVIIVDTSAGIGRMVLSFCMASDHTVLVTTPEPTAMTDAYTVLKALTIKRYNGRVSLLVNKASSVAEGKNVYRQVSTAAAQFIGVKLHHTGVLLRDERVSLAVKKRQPVVLEYPKCSTTRALMTVAARLSRVPVSSTAGQSFFKKVVNWFF